MTAPDDEEETYSREEIEALLAEYSPEAQAFIEDDEERLRLEREAVDAQLARYRERDEAEKRAREKVEAMLVAKGVRLNILACGCCNSPWVSIEIDGELVVDDESEYGLNMIPEAAE